MKRDGFVFYRSFYEAIEKLPKEDQLEAYKALVTYAIEGEEIEIENKIVEIIYCLMKPQIDANNKKASDGGKGGRPKKQKKPVVSEIKTSGYENKKPNDKDKDKYNVKDKDNVQEIVDGFSFSQELKKYVEEFIKHRDEIKSPMTQRALTMFLNKVKQLNEHVAIEAIKAAVVAGRQDIYPDKIKPPPVVEPKYNPQPTPKSEIAKFY